MERRSTRLQAGLRRKSKRPWRDRGVEAIAYPQVAGDHSSLWDSLEVWAQRADDPLGWQQRVLELAKRGPRNLEKHERGQVASLRQNRRRSKTVC